MLALLARLREQAPELRILLLGLDGAGKTALLRALIQEDPTHTSPTAGFNIKTMTIQEKRVNFWDLGGAEQLRPYWANYLENSDAWIYLVDGHDQARLRESVDAFYRFLLPYLTTAIPIVFLLTKSDLSSLVSVEELRSAFRFSDLPNPTKLIVMRCSAFSPGGLEGVKEWLGLNLSPQTRSSDICLIFKSYISLIDS